MPPNFYEESLFWENGALYHKHEKNQKENRVKILSFPFGVKSIHRGELKADNTYYLLSLSKPHDGTKEWSVPASALVGPNAVPMLADQGVVVHNAELFKQYVRLSVDKLNADGRSKMSFEQFGWKENENAFLYGDRLYRPGGVDTTALSGELRYRSQWLRPTPAGSLLAWKNAIDCLMGAGSEGQSFTVLASFAAPLMRFLEDNEGGAVVNLMTSVSGAGKTTSLAAASSVWASDARALGLTSIDTKVSKSVSLGAIANLPLTYDEFGNKDPGAVREFIVTFTSGRDKLRADSSGQLIHNAASWQTILISAGNRSLIDQIVSTGESDAPAMRILEFPVQSAGDLKPSEAARLKRQLEENAGHAGHAFLMYLMKEGTIGAAKEMLARVMDEIYAKGHFRREHRFRVRTLAAVAVASRIVQKLSLIAFTPERINGWALKHFSEEAQNVVETRHIETLSRFLSEHLAETLIMPGPYERGLMAMALGEKPRVRCTVRVEIKNDAIHVSEVELRAWIERAAGGNYRETIAKLREDGVLCGERQMTLTAGTELRSGLVRVLTFDGAHPKLTGELRLVRESAAHELEDRRREEQKKRRLREVL